MHSSTTSKQAFRIGTAEKKLLLVLSYYTLLVVLGLTAFTWADRNYENRTRQYMLYFKCEALGVVPGNPCDRTGFERSIYIQLAHGTVYLLLGLLPAISGIYVIDVKELKQNSCCKTCFHDFRIVCHSCHLSQRREY